MAFRLPPYSFLAQTMAPSMVLWGKFLTSVIFWDEEECL
jgi:hypothetical protein